jgi:hypothetical protein
MEKKHLLILKEKHVQSVAVRHVNKKQTIDQNDDYLIFSRRYSGKYVYQ